MGQAVTGASLIALAAQIEHQAAGGRPLAAAISGPDWRVRRDRPIFEVELWPHQSLTAPGLKWFLGISAVFLAFPLLGILGTFAFWGLLPFMALAFWGIWYAIRRNARDLQISEVLSIWRDEVRVERKEPTGRIRRWQAVPRDVRVRIYGDAKVEDYLTLTGAGREIELGAFLAPEERVSLSQEVEAALTRAVRA
ncbi:MAG: DUF2244 domain-containing protein [Pseudomonadota bacterium]